MINYVSSIRREFIKGSVLAAAAFSLKPLAWGQDSRVIPICVQLYSVRDDCGKDFDGALARIAKMGFAGVEFAGYHKYGGKAKELRAKLDELGLKDDKLFKLAMALEKIALEDEYFVTRKLYPNVDFYSGIVYKAIGIPVSMFTALFAVARTVGWIAQWNEMIGDPEQKIARPRQLFTGAAKRGFVPIDKRK